MGRPNVICGDALFGHFAFYTQRRYLEGVTTLLDDYRDLIDPERARAERNRRRVTKAVKPLSCLWSGNAWKYMRRLATERITGQKTEIKNPPL
jgi:hypothetical protein